MLEIAVSAEPCWPGDTDWDALAARAVNAAITATPHGALAAAAAMVEVSVRLADDAEVRALNRDYRGKDAATNVLSFSMVQPDLIAIVCANSDDGEVLLGDVVLAHETCTAEAVDKGISLADHAAHLIVHGTLHLLGYDHIDDHAAEAMEQIEQDVLRQMGLHNPYHDQEDQNTDYA